jgi:hypothetical protein
MDYKLMLLAVACACGSSATASWPIGVEREVDEGFYMQVVAVNADWKIWRIETKSTVSCKAVKSAKGREHPKPVGFMSSLHTGTPFLEIGLKRKRKVSKNLSSVSFNYTWRTQFYNDIEIKYRIAGLKFWETRSNLTFNADEIGEQEFEVAVVSWEYPALYVGRVEEKATFDLAGLSWAKSQIITCEYGEPSQ